MGWVVLATALLVVSGVFTDARALDGRLDGRTFRSADGQFIVFGSDESGARSRFGARARTGFNGDDAAANLESGQDLVELDPRLLPVTCERVKRRLLLDLRLSDGWRGQIRVFLDPTLSPSAETSLVATRFVDGWRYQLQIPAVISAERLLHSLVHVILQERVDRDRRGDGARVPSWLVSGFVGRFLPEVESLVVEADQSVSRSRVRRNPLTDVLSRLNAGDRGILTFSELSLPAANRLSDAEFKHFRDCSQLLLTELLEMPRGVGAMQEFLRSQSKFLNWQTAFFEAFSGIFRTPLDVEKWWAIQTAYHRGKSAESSARNSLRKLDELLELNVGPTADSRTERSTVSPTIPIPTLIRDWPFDRQTPVLRQILERLNLIRVTADARVRPLLENYHSTLTKYLADRSTAGQLNVRKGQPIVSPRVVGDAAARRLEDLDRQREAIRLQIETVPKVP